MKFSELKNGYTVVLNDETVYTVWIQYDEMHSPQIYFVSKDGIEDVTNQYDEDSLNLKNAIECNAKDIREVYAPPVSAKDKLAVAQGWYREVSEQIFDTCLWCRPAKRRLTLREVEKRLGYPVEIVKEQNVKINSEVYQNSKGEVAVLYSPGWGAGWSTWEGEQLAYDKFVVDLFFDYQEGKVSVEEVEKRLEKHYNKSIYMGGWYDLCVEWVPRGKPFNIVEYDGNEYINYDFKEF